VQKPVATVVAKWLDVLDTASPRACNPDGGSAKLTQLLPVPATLAQVSPRAPECVYDNYNLVLMQVEGASLGWNATRKPSLHVYTAANELASSVGICARDGDSAPWGRLHPKRPTLTPCARKRGKRRISSPILDFDSDSKNVHTP